MSGYGILIVSHAPALAQGIFDLVRQVAAGVAITYTGGDEAGGIGTSFELIAQAITANPADQLLAFYDLGSAKMNLELAREFTTKAITIYEVPLVEGTYTAAALLQVGVSLTEIERQLQAMTMQK